ncbi:MAG: thioredoxin family protein [Pirellulaceae bacterium]
MSTTDILDLNYVNFDDEVLDTDQPVLVEFWDEFSYEPRQLAAVMDRLSEQYKGRVHIAQMDMMANWQTAHEFDVKHSPEVLLFQSGRVVQRIVGAQSDSVYQQALDDVLAKT